MPSRLRLTNGGLKIAQSALLNIFDGNRTQLARAAGVDRATVFRFFKQENLGINSFDSICNVLDLRWEEIGEDPLMQVLYPPKQHVGIDDLIRQTRASVQPRIQHDCDTMQLLVVRRNVRNSGIYISLDLLKTSYLDIDAIADEENLHGEIDESNFDRFGFQVSHSQRLGGDVAVQQHSHLFVYGKPGSGKTTYLQWLASQCNEGTLLADHVPIFLTFKDFAEAENRPSLQTYIEQHLSSCQIANSNVVAERLLTVGKLLLLMDGFDEVQEADRKRVRAQIQEIIARFSKCRFVFSCRLPLRFSLPGFEEVVVAEFDRRQVYAFAQRWFRVINQEDRSKAFMDQLTRHIAIGELARTPLLLTLLCLVFNSDEQFPRTRSDLYQRGFSILLNKWDEFRNVERDNPYQHIDSRVKEVLLRYIATKFFLQQKTLFWRRDVEQVIEDFYRQVYNVDPLRVPANAILHAIELQHGLITSRASNFCSFSHLTFQEYLTASHLVATSKYGIVYEHLTEDRWRFVIELIAELLDQPKIDEFLLQFKATLDKLVLSNEKISEFLRWLNTFMSSVAHTVRTDQPYKQTLLRAWYFVFTIEDPGAASGIKQKFRYPLDFPDYYIATNVISSETLDFHALFYRIFHADISKHDLFLSTLQRIYNTVKLVDIQMENALAAWFVMIKHQQSNHRSKADWWQTYQPYWKDRTQKFMQVKLNLRCNWNFTKEEKNLLYSYYSTTKLLSECLNRSTKVSPETYQNVARNLLKTGIEEDV